MQRGGNSLFSEIIMSSTNLSRRSFATGAALVGALASVPAAALASPEDDRDRWLALWRRYIEADKKDSLSINPLDDAQIQAGKEYPRQRIPVWKLSDMQWSLA